MLRYQSKEWIQEIDDHLKNLHSMLTKIVSSDECRKGELKLTKEIHRES